MKKIYYLQIIVVIAFLALPLSVRADVKPYSSAEMAEDYNTKDFVDEQIEQSEALVYGNCAENPQVSGYEDQDPRNIIEKSIWDDIYPEDTSRPATASFVSYVPPYSSSPPTNGGDNPPGDPSSPDPPVDPPIDPPVTPEPATLLLFGSAFVAIPLVRRYSKEIVKK